ncbi:MAG: maltotransferase domain-containing protein, partial [Bacteroidota bacterium]
MRNRVVIEHVQPEIDGGKFFIKRVLGETVTVTAAVFGDGHDAIRASIYYKQQSKKRWTEVFMTPTTNDVWEASFTVDQRGFY